jgi:hypothetical protein
LTGLARTTPGNPTGIVPFANGGPHTSILETDGQGRTVVTLKWVDTRFSEVANTASTADPSLIDGRYHLAIGASAVVDPTFGLTLVGTNTYDTHRLFGDIDGDMDVDADDIFGTPGIAGLVDALFASPLNAHLAGFDFEGDGDVDAADLSFFIARLFTSV